MPKVDKKAAPSERSGLKKFALSSLFAKRVALEDRLSALTFGVRSRPRMGRTVKAVKDVDTLAKAVKEFDIGDKRRVEDASDLGIATDFEGPVVTLSLPDGPSTYALNEQLAVSAPETLDLSVPTTDQVFCLEHCASVQFPEVDDRVVSAALDGQDPSVNANQNVEVVDVLQQLNADEEKVDAEVVVDILVQDTPESGEAPTVLARPALRRKPRKNSRCDYATAFPELPAIYLEGANLEAGHLRQLLNLKVEEHEAGGAVRNRIIARHRTQGTPAYKQSRANRRTATQSRNAVSEDRAPFLSGSCIDRSVGCVCEQPVLMIDVCVA